MVRSEHRVHVRNSALFQSPSGFHRGKIKVEAESVIHIINTRFLYLIKVMVNEMQHRLYGKSMPSGENGDIDYRNSSRVGYLSSTQALADYATLIVDLKNNLSATDSPVVVFGGSYGGSISPSPSHFRLFLVFFFNANFTFIFSMLTI